MSLQDLVNRTNGQHGWTVTGPDSGECTAIPHEWEEELSLGIVYGNACDTYDNAPDGLYIKTLNTPDNYPLPGAIVVWGAGALGSSVGHTAVALEGSDTNTLRVLEQNNPIGGAVRIHTSGYTGVHGWFYPRKLQAATPTATDIPTQDNEGVVNGQGLHVHYQPNTTSGYPWYYDDNEHITLLNRTHGENITTGPYAPSDWWYLTDKGWVSDAFIRTTHNPANVPDYVPATPPEALKYSVRPTTGIFGVDVSSFQGDIDWATLKNNIDFAIIRAGHVGESFGGGPNATDTKLTSDRDTARAEGIPIAFYWFCYPSLDPADEAGKFIRSIGSLKDGESLWADIETDDPGLVDWAKAFKQNVEQLSGRKLRGYYNQDFHDRYPGLTQLFGADGIWAAHYGESAETKPFPEAIMHQYTSSGKLPGINGNVDLSCFFGSVIAFASLGATTTPPPASQPQPLPAPPPVTSTKQGGSMQNLSKYSKALVAVAGLALTVANLLLGNNHVLQLVISLLTVVGVHQFPNVDAGIQEVATDVKEA